MHERLCVHSICFGTNDLATAEQHWLALAPSRISMLSPLLDEGVEPVRAMLQRGGFALEAVTHLFTREPLSPRGKDWKIEQDRMASIIEAVADLGGRTVYTVTGGHGTLTWEEAADEFCEAIAPCLKLAEQAGIELLLEPVPTLYAEGHIAHSLRDTVTLAELSGLGVCIDIFSCWSEAGLRQTIERAMPRTHLVQIGDYVFGDKAYPCRAIPGEGDLPLRRIIGWIVEAGYAGNFDIEVFGPRTEGLGCVEAVRRSADYLGAMFADLGI